MQASATTPLLRVTVLAGAAAALLAAPVARAADTPGANGAPASGDQVIVPEIDRRDVKKPRIPSNDIELGLFGGAYSTDNFGSSGVAGARIGYAITEDFFVEGDFGFSRVSDKAFRQVLPGGIFSTGVDTLRYREFSLGWNVFPGETFLWRNTAFPSALYLIAGFGTTSFDQQRAQTASFGAGWRLMLRDWLSYRLDVRDHLFALDLLGRRSLTQNPEITMGLSAHF